MAATHLFPTAPTNRKSRSHHAAGNGCAGHRAGGTDRSLTVNVQTTPRPLSVPDTRLVQPEYIRGGRIGAAQAADAARHGLAAHAHFALAVGAGVHLQRSVEFEPQRRQLNACQPSPDAPSGCRLSCGQARCFVSTVQEPRANGDLPPAPAPIPGGSAVGDAPADGVLVRTHAASAGAGCFAVTSSGQCRCQSRGRRSRRVTAPPVARSMAAQRSSGTGLIPPPHCDTITGETPTIRAMLAAAPRGAVSRCVDRSMGGILAPGWPMRQSPRQK